MGMGDVAGLAIGLILGVWSTRRLEGDAATFLHGRSLSPRQGSVPPGVRELPPLDDPRCAARDLSWLLGHWAVRFVPIVAVIWVMVAWSSTAPLAGLGGFWLGRTSYLLAALLKMRQRA
jgi:hypothetical protein